MRATPCTYAQFQKVNPHRSPNWRAAFVESSLENRRPPSRREHDRQTLRYWRFLKAYRRLDAAHSDDYVDFELYQDFPDNVFAYNYEHHPDHEWRSILRALLLAGCSIEAAAAAVGCEPGTVETFCQLYFDVTDRLDQPLYISKIIGDRQRLLHGDGEHTVITQARRCFVYELFGYFGGINALEIVVSGFGRPKHVTADPEAAAEWLDDAARRGLRRTVAMTTQVFQPNNFNLTETLNAHLRSTELIHARKRDLPQSTALQEQKTLHALLENLPLLYDRKKLKLLPAAVQEIMSARHEPRADRLLEIGIGLTKG